MALLEFAPFELVWVMVGSGVVVTWALRNEVSLVTPWRLPIAALMDEKLKPVIAANCVAVSASNFLREATSNIFAAPTSMPFATCP